MGIPDFGYADSSYADYRTANSSRDSMIYVGSNDGFLHGFKAANGVEQIAYIPSILFRNNKLSKLTQDDYGKTQNPHAFYVDGTPTIGDASSSCGTAGCSNNVCPSPTSGTNWKTILVGGLNSGGQSLYALDVSDPSLFAQTSAAANKVALWEFSDSNDTDTESTLQYGLGYTFSRPAVVKVCTSRDTTATSIPKPCLASRWAAVMGNGYNSTASDGYASTSGYAILYVLDAVTGAKITKISTKTGTSGTPNGLPNIAVADVDGDGVADYAYSGDLQGNMWKFDLTDSDAANVAVADGTAATPLPLYIAKDSGSNRQPISSAPELMSHPDGGVMVLFGTGLYLQESDKATTATQTFYGVWDNAASLSTNTRANLQEQSIIAATSQVGFQTSTRNTVDWLTKKGWYMDLPNSGERVAFDPTLFRKVIYFTSLQPDTDICKGGGTSWDTLLDVLTGSSLANPVFADAKEAITGTGITGRIRCQPPCLEHRRHAPRHYHRLRARHDRDVQGWVEIRKDGTFPSESRLRICPGVKPGAKSSEIEAKEMRRTWIHPHGVMITVAIVAILAAIAMPSWANCRRAGAPMGSRPWWPWPRTWRNILRRTPDTRPPPETPPAPGQQ